MAMGIEWRLDAAEPAVERTDLQVQATVPVSLHLLPAQVAPPLACALCCLLPPLPPSLPSPLAITAGQVCNTGLSDVYTCDPTCIHFKSASLLQQVARGESEGEGGRANKEGGAAGGWRGAGASDTLATSEDSRPIHSRRERPKRRQQARRNSTRQVEDALLSASESRADARRPGAVLCPQLAPAASSLVCSHACVRSRPAHLHPCATAQLQS